tara:strand:+ start:301 stop:978 length:678 start_codon:yes stop_codon:yes gene_type:complete
MAFLDRFFGKTLYFPGCATKFLGKDIQKRHEKLLKNFGIKYITLAKEEVCCGKPARDYGYKQDFQQLAKKNTTLFEDKKVTKLITSCPLCYNTFKNYDWGIEVEHISKTILENKEKLPKKSSGELITLYDTCNSTKDPTLYNAPREILQEMGYTIKELPFCKEKSLCCGKVLDPLSPKIAQNMAESVLEMVKTKKVVCISPDCTLFLKKHAKPGIEVIELSELML